LKSEAIRAMLAGLGYLGFTMRVVLVLFLLLLAACDHSGADAYTCSGYGFQPGTDGYAGCLMQRDGGRRSAAATIAVRDPFKGHPWWRDFTPGELAWMILWFAVIIPALAVVVLLTT
jgi:hypothetical protein